MGIGSKEHTPSCQFGQDRLGVELESSKFVKPLQRGKDSSPCSNGSTCPEDNLRVSHTVGILIGSLDSTGSSMTRPENHRNLIRFAFVGLGLCRHVSRLL